MNPNIDSSAYNLSDPRNSFFSLRETWGHATYHRYLYELAPDSLFRPRALGALAEGISAPITYEDFRKYFFGRFAWAPGAKAPDFERKKDLPGWRKAAGAPERSYAAHDAVLKAQRVFSVLSLVDPRLIGLAIGATDRAAASHERRATLLRHRGRRTHAKSNRAFQVNHLEMVGDFLQPACHTHSRTCNFSNFSVGGDKRALGKNYLETRFGLSGDNFRADTATRLEAVGYETDRTAGGALWAKGLDPQVTDRLFLREVAAHVVLERAIGRFVAAGVAEGIIAPQLTAALAGKLYYPIRKARFDPAQTEFSTDVLLGELPPDLLENLLGVRDRAMERAGEQTAGATAPIIIPVAPDWHPEFPVADCVKDLFGTPSRVDRLVETYERATEELRADPSYLAEAAKAAWRSQASGSASKAEAAHPSAALREICTDHGDELAELILSPRKKGGTRRPVSSAPAPTHPGIVAASLPVDKPAPITDLDLREFLKPRTLEEELAIAYANIRRATSAAMARANQAGESPGLPK